MGEENIKPLIDFYSEECFYKILQKIKKDHFTLEMDGKSCGKVVEKYL